MKNIKNSKIRKCKKCGKEHDINNVRRSYGEFSNPYILGYCSARCYTKDTIGI